MAATDICANANIGFLNPQTIPFPKIYSFAFLQKNFTQNIRGRTTRPMMSDSIALGRGKALAADDKIDFLLKEQFGLATSSTYIKENICTIDLIQVQTKTDT